jgi:5-methylcytosine-specific restriction protein A
VVISPLYQPADLATRLTAEPARSPLARCPRAISRLHKHYHGVLVFPAVQANPREASAAACPLCCLCEAQGLVVPATVADHHPRHGGDYNKFRTGPLRSLCRDCHPGVWATDKRGYSSAIDEDGFPVDSNHPFNKTNGACRHRASRSTTGESIRPAMKGPSHALRTTWGP